MESGDTEQLNFQRPPLQRRKQMHYNCFSSKANRSKRWRQ